MASSAATTLPLGAGYGKFRTITPLEWIMTETQASSLGSAFSLRS